MADPRFSAVRACVFDAYGTLFDVHSAVACHRERFADRADAVSDLWRRKQLEYTWLRSLMHRHADFWQVTADALDYALDAHAVADAALRGDLLEAYRRLTAYPEVPGVLGRLQGAGMPCAILSNGAPEMLQAAVASAGLAARLDAVLSVEAVGVFKPDPRVYRLACEHFDLAPEQIAFLSSNAWDAAGAAAFGLTVAWCNRFAQHPERLPAQAQAEIRDLNGLLPLLGL